MKFKKLVVIIPAYNEGKTIGKVIQDIPRNLLEKVEVLVVDDGSSDDTAKKSKAQGADKVYSFKHNRGLGIAFQKGIDLAIDMGADIIVNIDADGQFKPKDIKVLIKPILEEKTDVSICSRFLEKQKEPDMPGVKKFGNKMFSKVISYLSGVKLTDTQCGFRAYTRDVALNLNTQSQYTYTQESILEIIEKGYKIQEVPLIVEGARKGKSRIVDSSFKYGLRSLLILLRTIRDYHALRFFGSIGISIFSLGSLIELFLFIRWMLSGVISPYKSLVTIAATFMILGFLVIILALIADMQNRQRKNFEKTIYYLRK